MSQKRQKKCENLSKEPKQCSSKDQTDQLQKEDKDKQTSGKGSVTTVDSSPACSSARKDSAPQQDTDASNYAAAYLGTVADTDAALNSNTQHSEETSCPEVETNDKETLKKFIRDLLLPDNIPRELKALNYLKVKLSLGDKPTMEAVIKPKVIRRCVHFLRRKDDENLPLESVRVIHLITAGTEQQVRAVADYEGAVEALIDLLQPKNASVEIALCALGNIVNMGPALRNFVISKNIIPRVVDLVESANSDPLIPYIVLVMYKLCGAREPSPPKDKLILCLPAVSKIIRTTDADATGVIVGACSILSGLSKPSRGTGEETAEEMDKPELVEKLVEILDSGSEIVIISTLTSVLNFSNSTESRAQRLIDAKALPCLAKLLKSENVEIVRCVAGIVRNIASNGETHTTQVAKARIAPLLVDVIKTDKVEAHDSAIYALICITLNHDGSLNCLCESKVVQAICNLFKRTDSENEISILLSAIGGTVTAAIKFEKTKNVKHEIEKSGVVDVIKELRNHQNEEISELASIIYMCVSK